LRRVELNRGARREQWGYFEKLAGLSIIAKKKENSFELTLYAD